MGGSRPPTTAVTVITIGRATSVDTRRVSKACSVFTAIGPPTVRRSDLDVRRGLPLGGEPGRREQDEGCVVAGKLVEA